MECGWHNYSLFYRPDGFAVGYFETDDDFASACKRMDAHAVNRKWQDAMSKYTPSGTSPLDGGDTSLRHYFYLGTDTEASGPTSGAPCHSLLAATLAVGVGIGLAIAKCRK